MAAEGENGAPGIAPGGDWSIGLNVATSLSHGKVLALLGERLRPVYADLLAAPVPDGLADLLRRLDGAPPAKAP